MKRRRQLVSRPAHNRLNAGSIPAAATILLLFTAAAAAEGQTWLRGLDVAPEAECATYDRGAWGFDARRHRQDLADALEAAPYSGERIPAEPEGRAWHVEHVVALKEAAVSGLCDRGPDEWRQFANDRRNLTLAQARLNVQKGAADAGAWLPPTAAGRCYLVRTVVEVKGAYGLTVDQAEADALERVLLEGECGRGHSDFMAYFDLIEIPGGWQPWRLEWRRWEYERERAQRQAALEALRASQEAPAAVWRIGDRLFWTPPAAGPMPGGYRVEQGDTVLHLAPYPQHDGRAVYEYPLRIGGGPARVEAEHGGGLNHRVYSPDVHAGPEPAVLVQRIRYYASRRWRSQASRERWRRVLAGFGVPCGVGYAGRPPVCGLAPAMSAAEAREYDRRGWSPWWGHAATVLERLEAAGIPPAANN